MKSRIARAVLFLALGLCIYQGVCGFFEPKSVATRQMRYLDILGPDSIDVLFLGNSHMYAGVDPAVFWLEQGIPSLGMGSGTQPAYSTYFRLLEFLKTQKPKLVVIELNGFARDSGPATRHETHLSNNLGWRFSRNKLDMFNESFRNSGWTLYLDFMLGLPVYHSRYAALRGGSPALAEASYGKGYVPSARLVPTDAPEIPPNAEKAELHPETMIYFRKILECARERGFALLFTVIPYVNDAAKHQKIYNYVESAGREEGFGVLNYFRLGGESGFDFKTGFRDNGAHLNTLGAATISRHLAQYIKREYALPDRRKEPAYAAWNGWAERMRRNYAAAFNKEHPELGLR